MRTVLLALVGLTLAGCQHSPKPVAPDDARPAALPPPATTAPATASATAPETSAVPEPPIDPGADPQKVALVRSICPAAIKHHAGKVLVGCSACPFETDAVNPDGKVEVDPEEFWPVQALYPGAFSSPGAREVAAVIQGCGQHGLGGVLFAEQTSVGWRATVKFAPARAEPCEVYLRKDARALLVCQTDETWFSTHSTKVVVYDLARATVDEPWKGRNLLAEVTENGHAVCWGEPHTDGVLQGRVRSFRFEDLNHDGQRDLVVDVEHRATPRSPSLDRNLQSACARAAARVTQPDEAPTVDVAALLGKPAKEKLEFLFDGQDFQPTAKTAARLGPLAPLL